MSQRTGTDCCHLVARKAGRAGGPRARVPPRRRKCRHAFPSFIIMRILLVRVSTSTLLHLRGSAKQETGPGRALWPHPRPGGAWGNRDGPWAKGAPDTGPCCSSGDGWGRERSRSVLQVCAWGGCSKPPPQDKLRIWGLFSGTVLRVPN